MRCCRIPTTANALGPGHSLRCRPTAPAVWDEVFSRKLSHITPVFQPAEELAPGISRADRPRPDVNGTNGTWSGTVTHAPAGETFGWVFGQWNVPDVELIAVVFGCRHVRGNVPPK
jgi:hypothetical protein